jgi:hypothetical protein
MNGLRPERGRDEVLEINTLQAVAREVIETAP